MRDQLDLLRDCLAKIAGVCDTMPCRESFRYKSIEAFILSHGRPYRAMDRLPDAYRFGKPRECFVNSATMAVTRDVLYVEGYAILRNCPLPIYHAWIAEPGSDLAIDVTSENLVAYLGVAFTAETLTALWNLPTTYACVLDDPNNGHPILKMDDAQLAEILYGETHDEKTDGSRSAAS